MNNQQISKILEYYRLNHNYHSPYTFLIDGNFLKIALEKDINLQQKLKPLVSGKLRLKVTSCVISELQILGRDFAIVLEKAKDIGLLKCTHAFSDAIQCVVDHLRKQQSVVVCSQDLVLRRKLRGRNVAIMYFGPDQRITMEDVERHQFKDMKQAQKLKFMPQQHQKQQLEEYRAQQQVIQKVKRKNQEFKMASMKGVELKYIKKKVKKGPNPLSVKKKEHNKSDQMRPASSTSSQHNQENGQGMQKKKRIRKKNKNKNSNTQN